MKIRNTVWTTVTLLVLAVAVFSEPVGIVQVDRCQKIRGVENVINNGNGTTSGTITQGGRLDGITQSVFTSAFTATPDPATFSFTDDLTLTTNNGVIETHNVTLFNVSNGLFTAIAVIDPRASTGIFAGASGVIYISGKTNDGTATFSAVISGEVCYAASGNRVEFESTRSSPEIGIN